MINRGFSIIELLVALVITSILACIGYAIYHQHILQAQYAEAKTALFELAQLMEHYYTENNTYEGASLARLHAADYTEHRYYNLNITTTEQGNNYLLAATPQAAIVTGDNDCGTFTLDAKGKYGITGTRKLSECW